MTTMIKIRRMKLVNFSGIQIATKRESIEFTRSDNPICLLIGANGSGKTTLMTELSPSNFEHLQGRTEKRIVDDKVGIKELDIEFNNRYLYKIVITYDKKTSCSIKKFDMNSGEEIGELNPTGNVNSYMEIIEQELGYTKSYINIGFLNSRITDVVNMSATNRSNYLQVWLPQISEYVDSYNIALKKNNVLKKQIDLLNNEIGKLSDTDYDIIINNYNSSLLELQSELASKQEIYTQKKTYIDLIKSNYSKQQISEKVSALMMRISNSNQKRDMLLQEVKSISKYMGTQGKNVLQNDITHNEKQAAVISNELNSIDNNLLQLQSAIEEEQKQFNANYHNDFIAITNTLRQIETDMSSFLGLKQNYLNNKDIPRELDNFTTKDIDLYVTLVEDLNTYYTKISTIINPDYLLNFNVFENYVQKTHENTVKYKEIIEKTSQNILLLSNQLYNLENSTITKEILDLRPNGCNTSCGIVNEILRFINPEQEINALKQKLASAISEETEYKSSLEHNQKLTIDNKTALYLINELNDKLYKQKEFIIRLPEKLRDIFSDQDVCVIFSKIPELLLHYKDYEEYVYLIDKIRTSEDVMKTAKVNYQLLEKQERNYKIYQNLLDDQKIKNQKRTELITHYKTITDTVTKLKSLTKLQEENNSLIEIFNSECKLLAQDKELLKVMINEWYVKGSLIDTTIILENDIITLKNNIQQIIEKLEEIRNRKNSILTLTNTRNTLLEKQKKIEILMQIWSVRSGYPNLLMDEFLDTLVVQINKDLQEHWGSSLRIENFNIGSNEFSIPVYRDEKLLSDVSECSDGERATLALAISFAIIEINLKHKPYNSIRLDEVDAIFDSERRRIFLELISNRLISLNCVDAYIISHNTNLNSIPADCIILKDANVDDIDLSNKTVIFQI